MQWNWMNPEAKKAVFLTVRKLTKLSSNLLQALKTESLTVLGFLQMEQKFSCLWIPHSRSHTEKDQKEREMGRQWKWKCRSHTEKDQKEREMGRQWKWRKDRSVTDRLGLGGRHEYSGHSVQIRRRVHHPTTFLHGLLLLLQLLQHTLPDKNKLI